MKIEKYIPEIKKLSLTDQILLKEKFIEVYEKRKKLSGKKAIFSARAAVFSEIANDCIKEAKIKRKEKEEIERSANEDFPFYIYNKYRVALSKDLTPQKRRKLIKDFKYGDVISSGDIQDMQNEFDKEMIAKILNKYNLNVDKNFGYIIYESHTGVV